MWRNYEFVSGFIVVVERGDIRIVQRSCERRNYKLHTYVTSLGATRNDSYMAHIGGCINDKVMVRLNIHGPHSNYRVQFARRPIYQA
jgi:hypothetical protein